MAVTVPAGSTTQVKKVVTEPTVKVAKVVVGRHVRHVTSGGSIAVTVPAGSTTQLKKVTTEPNIKVAKVVVGRPVRRVTSGAFALSTLYDVDVSSLENGSLLIYNTSTSKWTASKNVEDGQNINGGSY